MERPLSSRMCGMIRASQRDVATPDPDYQQLLTCRATLEGLPPETHPSVRALWRLSCALWHCAVELDLLALALRPEAPAPVGRHNLRLALCEQCQRQFHQQRMLSAIGAELEPMQFDTAAALLAKHRRVVAGLLELLSSRTDLPAWSDDGG